MITMSNVNKDMPDDYYSKERGETLTDYYSRNLDKSQDFWHGRLAERMGYKGPVKIQQYATLKEELSRPKDHGGFGRNEIVFKDITFSAPKSVSNLLAYDETRQLVIDAMLEANEKVLHNIEDNYLQTKISKSGNRFVKSDNMVTASWIHEFSRAMECDLHVHNTIANVTYVDGKMRAIDWQKIVNNKAKIDLEYLQELAHSLRERGIKIEAERVNEQKRGSFRVVGSTREIDLETSSGKRRIDEAIAKTGDNSYNARQEAETATRQKKIIVTDKQKFYDSNREKLDSLGNKYILKDGLNKEDNYYEFERLNTKDFAGIGEGFVDLEPRRTVASAPVSTGKWRRSLEESTPTHGLQNLFQRGFHQEPGMSPSLLPSHQYRRLATQYDAARSNGLRLPRAEEKRRNFIQQRVNLIDTVTEKVVKELSAQDFCFTLPKLVDEIRRYDVTLNFSEDECKLGIERAKLVNLERFQRPDGSMSKDVYLTTEKNIYLEIDNIDRALGGKDKMKWSIDRNKLERDIEKYCDKQLKTAGFAPSVKQQNAIRLLLGDKDKVCALQGIAGTGKTTTAKAVKAIADNNGVQMYGASFTGKAANGLQAESGINSFTLHSLLNRIENGEFSKEINGTTRNQKAQDAFTELLVESLPKTWQKAIKKAKFKGEKPQLEGADKIKHSAKELFIECYYANDREGMKNAYKALRESDKKLLRHQQEKEREKSNLKFDKDVESGKIDLNRDHDFSNVPKLKAPTVILVDEAGLTNDHLMHELLLASSALGDNCKIVLQGDYKQLQSIGRGECYKQLLEHGIKCVKFEDYEDIHRQNDPAFQGAVYQASAGEPSLAWDYIKKQGWTHEIKDDKKRFETVKNKVCETKLKDIVYEKDGERKMSVLMLASTNMERKKYNEMIRNEYIKRGELEKGESFTVCTRRDNDQNDVLEKRNFAANDRIIFLQNDKNKLDVMNGQMGTIQKIEGDNFTVLTDSGKTITFDINDYNNIDHSYCVTTYKSQGMTVDKVYIDSSKSIGGLQEFYVEISRAKTEAEIFCKSMAKAEKNTATFLSKKTVESFINTLQNFKEGGLDNLKRWQRATVEAPAEQNQVVDVKARLAELSDDRRAQFEKIIAQKKDVCAFVDKKIPSEKVERFGKVDVLYFEEDGEFKARARLKESNISRLQEAKFKELVGGEKEYKKMVAAVQLGQSVKMDPEKIQAINIILLAPACKDLSAFKEYCTVKEELKKEIAGLSDDAVAYAKAKQLRDSVKQALPAISLSNFEKHKEYLMGLDMGRFLPSKEGRIDIKEHTTKNLAPKLTGTEKIAEVKTWNALTKDEQERVAGKFAGIATDKALTKQAEAAVGKDRFSEIRKAWNDGEKIDLSSDERKALLPIRSRAFKLAEGDYYYKDESTTAIVHINRLSLAVDTRDVLQEKGSIEIYAAEAEDALKVKNKAEKERNLTDEEKAERYAQEQEAEEKPKKTMAADRLLNSDYRKTGRIEYLLQSSIEATKAGLVQEAVPDNIPQDKRTEYEQLTAKAGAVRQDIGEKLQAEFADFSPAKTWQDRFGEVKVFVAQDKDGKLSLQADIDDPVWAQVHEAHTARKVGFKRWHEIKQAFSNGQEAKLTEKEQAAINDTRQKAITKTNSDLSGYYKVKRRIADRLQEFTKTINAQIAKEPNIRKVDFVDKASIKTQEEQRAKRI